MLAVEVVLSFTQSHFLLKLEPLWSDRQQLQPLNFSSASTPFFCALPGALLLVLAIEVSLSVIQSHFLLELKPLWSNGVLRYGYRDPSISQVLPVITSSVSHPFNPQ